MSFHLLPPHLKLAILSSLDNNATSSETSSVLNVVETHSTLNPFFDLATINASALVTLTREQISHLHRSGFVIIDDYGSTEMLNDVRRDCQSVASGGDLKSGGMHAANENTDKRWQATSYRGDRMRWLNIDDNSKDRAPQSIRRVIESAVGLQAELNAVIPELQSASSHSQFAVYDGNGERYVRHRDTHATGPKRRFTVIYYANVSEWRDEYGGELRIFPYDSCSDDSYIDVKPIGGRIIIFDSRCLHEVRPSYAQRIAITTWLT